MSTKDVMYYVILFLVIILGWITSYIKTKSTLMGNVAKLIADAEQTYENVKKSGDLKMAYVVNQLYNYIPKIMKPFFTKEILEQIAQSVFDEIENYCSILLGEIIENMGNSVEDVKSN